MRAWCNCRRLGGPIPKACAKPEKRGDVVQRCLRLRIQQDEFGEPNFGEPPSPVRRQLVLCSPSLVSEGLQKVKMPLSQDPAAARWRPRASGYWFDFGISVCFRFLGLEFSILCRMMEWRVKLLCPMRFRDMPQTSAPEPINRKAHDLL